VQFENPLMQRVVRSRVDATQKSEVVMANYDAIIIGTGQSGPALALRLVAAGWKVAIIERKLFGGTCVNTGCTPTRALVARRIRGTRCAAPPITA
jgi:cation diffusion facilitator CzcD-associated flavoprotein CzcO